MSDTIHSEEHQTLIAELIDARKRKGLSQTQLGDRLGRTQKFISLIETGQRRLDVIEFINYCQAMDYDAVQIFREFKDKLHTDK